MTLRIITTADNHLGRYYARMPIRTLDERRRRIRQAFGKALDHALGTRAHLLLLAGDLFDNPNPRNPDRIFLARRLRALNQSGVRTFAIGGNHDAPRSSTEEGGHLPLAVYHALEALHFFNQLDEDVCVKPEVLSINGLTVAVAGFTPSTNLPTGKDPLEGVTVAATDADVRILMVHAGIEGMMFPGNEGLIKRETIERLSNVDVLVAGNVHCYDSFRVGGVQVIVPGATEWMDYGELKSVRPGFVEIEVEDRTRVSVRHIPIEPQPRIELSVSASELDPDDPTSTVLERLGAGANAESLARLTLEGTVSRDDYAKLDIGIIEDRARESFFFCDIDLSGLRVRFEHGPAQTAIGRRSIPEEIDQVVSSLLAQTDDEQEAASLELTRQALQSELRRLEQ